MENKDRKEKLSPVALILIFSILAAGTGATGYVYYRNYEKRYRVEVEHGLSAIGKLKAAPDREGIMEGRDRRCARVIADVRPVPDSPWLLNSRMDTEEVYAPLRERLWLVILLIGAMVMCAGACMVLIWRERTTGFHRERYVAAQALQDSEEKLKAVVYGSPIPKFVIDRDHKLIYWNKALEEISGIKAGK